MTTLLEIRDLTVEFRRRGETITAVDEVSLSVTPGECVALAGESGSGKSTLARVLTGLVSHYSGQIIYRGVEMPRRMRAREPPWLEIQMVFQDPGGSLNPRKRVGAMLHELLAVHGLPRSGSRRNRVSELLSQVGLSADVAEQLPARLSGGQKQRAAIAAALAVDPRLLICDEAVSALDVSIRAQILELLKDLQRELGLAYLFITHDLAVARQMADRALIMYHGRLLEAAPTAALFNQPLHPYTRLLIDSIPSIERPHARSRDRAGGAVPEAGCVFAPRCAYATDESHLRRPRLERVKPGRAVACHNWQRNMEKWRQEAADQAPERLAR